jgi:hypothetical protein
MAVRKQKLARALTAKLRALLRQERPVDLLSVLLDVSARDPVGLEGECKVQLGPDARDVGSASSSMTGNRPVLPAPVIPPTAICTRVPRREPRALSSTQYTQRRQSAPPSENLAMTHLNMMTAVLALICWTFVMWFWLYATRLPAMKRAGIGTNARTEDDLAALPLKARQVADNYNHLHEQPTIFYALAFYSQLAGVSDALNTKLAWSYVALRVLHSLIHATVNTNPLRFSVFAAGSLVLMVIAARNVAELCCG